jgi:fibronectin-binding autotransporter adhesin
MGNTVINGGGTTRAFNVTVEGDVYIGILTITNCAINGSGAAILNPTAILRLDGIEIIESSASGDGAAMGGGAVHNMANLQVNRVRFMNNSATGSAGSGGAILNTSGGFSVTNSSFSGNTAIRAGGAIEDASGSGTSRLITTSMTGNAAGASPGNGGGVHITGGSRLVVNGGNYSGNTAAREGGALWNGSGTMIVTGVMISGNTASGDAADDGGGIFNNGGTANILGVTINNNSSTGASGSGGGLMTTGGTVTVIGCRFMGNSANRAGGAVEQIDGLYSSNNNVYDGNTVGFAPGNGGAFHVTGRPGR